MSVAGYLIIFAVITIYFLPTVIAATRGMRFGGILIINLLLGWSVVGWVIALVMSCGQVITAREIRYGARS